jgi:hypothetical protein
MSKTFSLSKNTVAFDILLLKFRATWAPSPIHWNVTLWSARKPDWLALNKFLSSVYFWIAFKIGFSKNLPLRESLDLCRVTAGLWILLPSKVPRNDQTEGSD